MEAVIKWDCSRTEMQLITKIVGRAEGLWKQVYSTKLDRMALDMDITACHLNGCPLKLEELLAADDFNFAHDVFGIRNKINRKTGKLTDCFLPRFAL
jgi:hypothetical protein